MRYIVCCAVLSAAPGVGVFAGPASFTDQTAAAGVDVTHDTSGFSQSNYAGGACIGDFNDDGYPDLFVVGGGDLGSMDHLFINQGDGTFADEAAAWGLIEAHKGKGACVGDYNNDGRLDLYVLSAGPAGQSAAIGHHKLYRNNGDDTFTNVAVAARVDIADFTYPSGWTACFGDYDLDGDLDLYVGGFQGSGDNDGNHLFRNNGDGVFSDMTNVIDLWDGVPGGVANLSAAFLDMDGDRYPELLLGGDFKNVNGFIGSRYFRNNTDGTFTDLTNASDTGDEENGMGQTRGDFNNDGLFDWYVTSIYLPQIGWTGNKLYINLGGHQYSEQSVLARVEDGGYGWGACAADFNHDQLLDIAETNGDGAGSGTFHEEQSYLYLNDGDGTFTETALASGFVHEGKGRSLLHFDYDLDGDQDLVVSSNNEPLFLFRNEVAGTDDAHWLRVTLDTDDDPDNAPDGIGAVVRATVGAVTMTRAIDAGASYLGNSELVAHFGLGNATMVDELIVEWTNGEVTVLTDVAADQHLTIASTTPCPADLDSSGAVGAADLAALLTQWGGPGTADFDSSGAVGPEDLSVLLSAWGACR